MSTFTLPKHYNGIPGQDMLHFGVGTYAHNELNPRKNPFWQDNALFASKAKINVFWNFFE